MLGTVDGASLGDVNSTVLLTGRTTIKFFFFFLGISTQAIEESEQMIDYLCYHRSGQRAMSGTLHWNNTY